MTFNIDILASWFIKDNVSKKKDYCELEVIVLTSNICDTLRKWHKISFLSKVSCHFCEGSQVFKSQLYLKDGSCGLYSTLKPLPSPQSIFILLLSGAVWGLHFWLGN